MFWFRRISFLGRGLLLMDQLLVDNSFVHIVQLISGQARWIHYQEIAQAISIEARKNWVRTKKI